MADALDSKSSGRKVVGVQVPPLVLNGQRWPEGPGKWAFGPSSFLENQVSPRAASWSREARKGHGRASGCTNRGTNGLQAPATSFWNATRARLLNVDHTTVWRWMSVLLVADGALEIVVWVSLSLGVVRWSWKYAETRSIYKSSPSAYLVVLCGAILCGAILCG